jgi:hypothetical protein
MHCLVLEEVRAAPDGCCRERCPAGVRCLHAHRDPRSWTILFRAALERALLSHWRSERRWTAYYLQVVLHTEDPDYASYFLFYKWGALLPAVLAFCTACVEMPLCM